MRNIEKLKHINRLTSTPALALGIALLITLIPTARAHNSGYVDPNLYIGYATNLKWLVESGGFEYHATRLPFIGLISLIITFSSQNFGLIYKFLSICSLAFICLKACERLQIPKKLASLATTLICLSPLVTSASSWTMPNAFAGMFSCLLIPFVLKEKFRNVESVVIGFLLATSFLLNAFGSSLLIILIAVVNWLRKISLRDFFHTNLLIGIGIMIAGFVYQLIWTFAIGLPDSLWKPHFNVIFDNDLLVSNWAPIASPTAQGVTSYIIIGLILVTLFLICRNQKLTNLLVPIVALIVTYVFSWITYLMKINFSFNAFWYYYIYLPLFILVPLITLKVVLIITSPFSKQQKSSILRLLPATLLLVGVSSSFGLQIKNPSLMTAYKSLSNNTSSQLLEDEITLSKFLKALPSNRNLVATWYEPDTSGYRGSLLSSASFHLLRFEGVGESQSILDFEEYFQRTKVRPLCLVMITSTSWKISKELDRTKEYSKVSSVVLPSEQAKVTLYCRENL